MPIYEYECIPNKHKFEVIQKFIDPPVTHCTVCGEPVQKLLSSSAIQFKGTGWYVTDYAKKSSAPETSKEKPAAAKPSTETSPPSTESPKTESSKKD